MTGLDPRGPRFVAAVTAVVLVVVLVTGSGWLTLAQTAAFALGSVDPGWNPYALVYRWLVRPRLRPPTEKESPEPVRFAQRVGLAFLAVATVGYLGGLTGLGATFAGLGLAAAFLNAAFGLCLGCEVYVALQRTRRTS
ncbi:DUF4395 domain-containing protein [Virgisporangium ochraceum]|uniref:Membrane protein n=1 Tax=Virgisporangium ochraceum TaxID=65505 RepID=A0A8J4EBI0_9ACTN|nr:DUF4395 domain-containing protein [Virgisporangium ochraceum]GIJ68726.1 membrane protein [Virgisporangium ochraceum]